MTRKDKNNTFVLHSNVRKNSKWTKQNENVTNIAGEIVSPSEYKSSVHVLAVEAKMFVIDWFTDGIALLSW